MSKSFATDRIDEIQHRLLPAVVAHTTGKTIQSLNPISNLNHANLVWDCIWDDRPAILRVAKGEKEYAVYAKEAWCLQQATSLGLDAAKVLGWGSLETDTVWMLQTKLDGMPGNLFDGDAGLLWRAMGQHARRLTNIPVTGYGEWAQGQNFKYSKWSDFCDQQIALISNTDALVQNKFMTAKDFSLALDYIDPVRDWNEDPSLVHGDLLARNCLVEETKIVHVIDYGMAWSGRPFVLDMVNINASEQTQDLADERIGEWFADGYGLSPSEYTDLKPEIDRYTALHLLRHSAWLVCQPDSWLEKTAQKEASMNKLNQILNRNGRPFAINNLT